MKRILFLGVLIGSINLVFGQVDFEFTPHIETGNEPIGLTSKDINDDSIIDLIYLNEGDNSISVRLGKGDGQFEELTNYVIGGGPKHFTLADINGDGNDDLLVAVFGQDIIAILFGTGNGGFENRTDIAAGDGPFDIATGMIDGDSNLDLAVSFFNADSVGIYSGLGDGTFSSRKSIYAFEEPSLVELDTLDNDDLPDLLVAYRHGVAVYSNSSGEFIIHEQLTDGIDSPLDMLLSDFNNDDVQDILVISFDLITHKLNGDGNGGFNSQESVPTSSPLCISVFDIDNDGDQDIVAGDMDNFISILKNQNGSFAHSRNYLTGTNPKSMALNDFDSDGLIDIAVANNDDNSIGFNKGEGSGSFSGIEVLNHSTHGAVIKTDLNGDGQLDLAYAKNSNYIGVLYRTKDSFSSEFLCLVDEDPEQVISFDVDNDGILDLVSINSGANNMSILINNGDSTFQDRVDYTTGANPSSITSGDFNNDNLADIVVGNIDDNNVKLFLNQGAGVFVYSEKIDVSNAIKLIPTKINDDDYLDLVIASDTESTKINYGSSTNSFNSLTEIDCIRNPSIIADLNGDNYNDLLSFYTGLVYVNGTQTGLETECAEITYSGHDQAGGIANINKNDFLDLVSYDTDGFSILESRGDGTFTDPTNYEFYIEKRSLLVYDVDADSLDDLIFSNQEKMFIIKNTSKPESRLFVSLNDTLNVSLNSSNFIGDAYIGDVVASSFTLLNDGSATLNVDTVYIEGDGFSMTEYPEKIEAFSNSAFVISFSPTETGRYEGEVIIKTDSNPTVFTLGIYGNGVEEAHQVTSLENLVEWDVNLYPNPVENTLFISQQKSKINKVTILNLNGIKLIEYKNNFEKIDVSNLNEGIYVVKIELDSKVITQRILKL